MRPETILFDVDGTLLDTREFFFGAVEHAGRSLGFEVPGRSALAALSGNPLRDLYVQHAGAGQADEAVIAHRKFQTENLSLVNAFEGVAELLASLQSDGIALAAVTSRSKLTAQPSLELTQLEKFLGAVVAAEDAPTLKPDPAPLLLALKQLGKTVDRAWMVGDTPTDIQAGRALGMHTVAARYGFREKDVLAAGPDHAIAMPSELRELVTRHRG